MYNTLNNVMQEFEHWLPIIKKLMRDIWNISFGSKAMQIVQELIY